METFLPSEIGRLIYGYLHEHCGLSLAEEFSKSCPSMQECRQAKHKHSRNFHTTVQDLSLEAILDQYSKLCSLIFRYSNENEHVHKNALNLLEKLLNDRQVTTVLKDQVFKDVQNLPSNRNASEVLVNNNEAAGVENKLVTANLKHRNSSVSSHNHRKSCEKKKLSVSSPSIISPSGRIFNLPGNADSVFNSGITISENSVKSHVPIRMIKQNSIAFDNYCKQHTLLTTSSTNVENINSNNSSPISLGRSHKSVFNSMVNTSQISSSCFSDSSNFKKQNLAIEDEISYSPLEAGVTDVIEDVEMNTVEFSPLISPCLVDDSLSAKKNQTESKLSNHSEVTSQTNINSVLLHKPVDSKSSRIKLDNLFSPNVIHPASSCYSSSTSDKSSLTSTSLSIHSDVVTAKKEDKNSADQFLIEKLEEGEIISSGSEKEDTKKIKSDLKSKKVEKKREFPQSEITEELLKNEKRSDHAKPAEKSVSSEAELPFLSEECRSIFESLSKSFKYRPPYTSPAKSTEFVHRAALSPFSKMYVTPTKPNFLHSVEYTRNYPVVLNPGGCSSSNISSYQKNSSPLLAFSSNSKNLQSSHKFGPSSANEKHSEEKSSSRKLPVPTQTRSKKLVESRNILLRKKVKQKSTSSNEPIDELNNEIKANKSLKKKRNIKLAVSSKSGTHLHDEDADRIRVYIQETNEIAELYISPEFVIFHRNSTGTFSESNVSRNCSR